MLRHLSVSNYALIDSIEIDFGPALSIITGETGAGKSILLGAFSLLLGGRADVRTLRDAKKKIVVEAWFDVADDDMQAILNDNDIDIDKSMLILRREILPNGRSRAFINDCPVNLKLLESVAIRLIDIHSQHKNLLLSSNKYQLHLIDSVADNADILAAYRSQFRRYVELRTALDELRRNITNARQEEEYIRFQLAQLCRLNPQKGEQQELERRLEFLNNAEEIKQALENAYELIEGDEAVMSHLSEVRTLLGHLNLRIIEKSEGDADELMRRFESVFCELKDIAATLDDYASDVQADVSLREKTESRLNDLYECSSRFQVESADCLPDIKSNLERRLELIDSSDDELREKEKEVKREAAALKQLAEKLTESRRAASTGFVDKLMELGRPLGMNNLKAAVIISPVKLTIDGQDNVELICAFNKNQAMQPVQKVASGGEISRLMLCIKTIVAGRMNLPTIVFDEIDTGVSGEIADRMGAMMGRIAEEIQVIAITHLPQVASKGEHHYRVYKTDGEHSTQTLIEELDGESRVEELARMLSGSKVDEAALLNARSLLGQNEN